MNILRSYKSTRFFLWVNITGLAIGLAVSIMLILFVVNELSYDKHFANKDRIVNLVTVVDDNGVKDSYSINLRKAYTEVPDKVPGVEAAVQIYNRYTVEVINNTEHYQNVSLLFTDPEFFKVFPLKFIDGTPETALSDLNSVVLTRKQAMSIFGSVENVIGKKLLVSEQEVTVSAVVEALPLNTHFGFDILGRMQPYMEGYGGLEFYTYYLIEEGASVSDVRSSIEREYTTIIEPFGKYFNATASGVTQKLTDIYLHSLAKGSLGKRNTMSFIWLLSGLALFILLLAVSNFINLFMAQGETRMNEIGIRKANGARVKDIVRLFFKEISFIVFLAFILGFLIAVVLTPYFSQLIDRNVDIAQLLDPLFIVCVIALFILTVIFSAFYPAFYLSRFTPLEILAKRLKFSKRRLNIAVVVFQSIITIVLISYILVIDKQTSYLENMPLGYNPQNVLGVPTTQNVGKNYEALKQELINLPEVKAVSGTHHHIGGGPSGQGIALLNDREKVYSINEYRVMQGLCELMEFDLKEGSFYKEGAPDSIRQIILNEAAINMLGLEYPVVGQYVDYKGTAEITGVVKDFYYGDPANKIAPIVLTRVSNPGSVYIRFNEGVSRTKAQDVILPVFRQFDPDFYINPSWNEDIYIQKFGVIKTQSRVVMISSFLSIFIAMLGLVAIHLYTTMRRMKEISIRRVNGASPSDIFILLSKDILKWIMIAGIMAIPIVYYISTSWLENFVNRTSLGWAIFMIPILLQCIIAIIVTSGISIKVILSNPVDALKNE